jgi:acetyl esterase/lipase
LTTPPASQPTAAPAASLEIVETLNVPYATVEGVEPNLLSLVIHAPKGAKAAPVVIYVHSGYWKACDKATQGHLLQKSPCLVWQRPGKPMQRGFPVSFEVSSTRSS